MEAKAIKPLLWGMIFLSTLMVTEVYAQTSKPMIISISGIENGDPNFAALQETLKKNPKVKSVKSSNIDGMANLSFNYSGGPGTLWDELPKSSKLFFKVTAIEDNTIELDYTKNTKSGSTGKSATTNTKSAKKDCGDCEYFPLCHCDLTINYQGKVYRGFYSKKNDINYYYRCEDGEVTGLWESTSTSAPYYREDYDPFSNTVDRHYYEGKTTRRTNMEIIIKANAPVGAKWQDGDYEMIAKGQTIVYDGNVYNDVIVIQNGNSNDYYAKGIGHVKTVEGSGDVALADLAAQKKLLVDLAIFKKGKIDKSMVGYWQNVVTTQDDMYAYKDDGTFERMSGGSKQQYGMWRLRGDTLDCWGFGNTMNYKGVLKKTITGTGKTKIDIGYGTYQAMGNQKPIRLMGAADLDTACNNWCGIWKLIEKKGSKYLPGEVTGFMEIKKNGTGSTFDLRNTEGSLSFVAGTMAAIRWSVWSEASESVVYLNFSGYNDNKGLPVGEKSIPQMLLIVGIYAYQYYGPEIVYEK